MSAQSRILIALVGASCAASTVMAQFRGMAPLAGGDGSSVQSVNGDGSVIVGLSRLGNAGTPARWVNGVPQQLDTLPGGSFPLMGSVSNDGSVIVGSVSVGTTTNPVRWDASGAISVVPYATGATTGSAFGVSGDGSTIVGTMRANGVSTAFRQVGNAPAVSLGTLGDSSNALATNGDGSVVVGYSGPVGGPRTAFRWTQATGIQSLGITGSAIAGSITSDGQVIVGRKGSSIADYRAFSWTQGGGVQDYGTLSGWTGSTFEDVSGDGSVKVGYLMLSGTEHAMMHTLATGMVDLNSYLPGQGVDLTGWTLSRTYGVSTDGRTIVGTGSFNGVQMGWAYTVPQPGTLALAMSGIFAARRRRQNRI